MITVRMGAAERPPSLAVCDRYRGRRLNPLCVWWFDERRLAEPESRRVVDEVELAQRDHGGQRERAAAPLAPPNTHIHGFGLPHRDARHLATGLVYVQDMKSNVTVLDAQTGRVVWRHMFGDTSPGPNGVAVTDGRVYGATDTTVFALAAANGRLLWSRRVITESARFIDMAPQVDGKAVYVSTIGLPPNGRGVLYALDAGTGKVLWKRSTILGRFAVPEEAGGGGTWYPPSVDASGVYWGVANPYPYGGSRAHPNGGAYAGPALYTDSLVVTDPATGHVLWYDQVTRHDVRDYDFEAPPILAKVGDTARVFGAGKAGQVIAWDETSHRRLWMREVGLHRNDTGPLPAAPDLGVSRITRRRRDAYGLYGRRAVRPGRESLRLWELARLPAARGTRSAHGYRRARRPRCAHRTDQVEAKVSAAGLRLRDNCQRSRVHVDVRRSDLRTRRAHRRGPLDCECRRRDQLMPCARARNARGRRRRRSGIRARGVRAQ